jgi:serine/threonine-protein kinase
MWLLALADSPTWTQSCRVTSTIERLTTALTDRYRVEKELGAGGMATVYLAHDLRHERDVAIKVLHPDLGAALGAERFLSEIKTTAKLQHPHILPLLDSGAADGLLYYVMPYVRGETLRSRLEREKQLPIADAVRIAREVAGALDHAHKQGIIHRDIKPENILLQDGAAVVADFGIALAVQQAGGQRMTQTGLSLGTPQYMSPEQAMGEKTIDARSDIYALGAVTYEMLAGEAPFTGGSVQAIVAKVLSERPVAMTVLRDTIPPRVNEAVLTALSKLPVDRFATAALFADALQVTGEVAHTTTARIAPPAARRSWRAMVIGAIVCTGVGALLTRWLGGGDASSAAAAAYTVAQLTPPMGEYWYRSGAGMALSPDGRTLAVVSARSPESPGRLMIRRLDEFEGRFITGTDGATYPFWSPDSKSIGFHANGAVQRVDLATGEVRTVCKVWRFSGGTWNAKGDILFGVNDRLMRARADGTSCAPLPRVLTDSLDIRPFFFGDGEHFLITTWSKMYVARLSADSVIPIDVPIKSQATVALPDQILTQAANSDLLVRRVDLSTGRLLGEPRRLASQVWEPWGKTAVTASSEGTIVIAGPGEHIAKAFMFAERGTGVFDTIPIKSPSWTARLSPDGRTIALGGFNVRLLDVAKRTITELSAAPSGNLGAVIDRSPMWTPDGSALMMRDILGRKPVRVLTVQGETWREDSLTAPGGRTWAELEDRSADGRVRYWAVTSDSTHPTSTIWQQEVSTGTLTPLVTDARDVEQPRVSPDGRWLAYVRFDTDWQVFVRPLQGGGAPVRVSRSGGRQPVWRADSRELFFVGSDRRIMAAAVTPAGVSNEPTTAFDARYLQEQAGVLSLDASPDGRHFYMLLDTGGARGFSVIFNWPAASRAVTPER